MLAGPGAFVDGLIPLAVSAVARRLPAFAGLGHRPNQSHRGLLAVGARTDVAPSEERAVFGCETVAAAAFPAPSSAFRRPELGACALWETDGPVAGAGGLTFFRLGSAHAPTSRQPPLFCDAMAPDAAAVFPATGTTFRCAGRCAGAFSETADAVPDADGRALFRLGFVHAANGHQPPPFPDAMVRTADADALLGASSGIAGGRTTSAFAPALPPAAARAGDGAAARCMSFAAGARGGAGLSPLNVIGGGAKGAERVAKPARVEAAGAEAEEAGVVAPDAF